MASVTPDVSYRAMILIIHYVRNDSLMAILDGYVITNQNHIRILSRSSSEKLPGNDNFIQNPMDLIEQERIIHLIQMTKNFQALN